MLSGYLGQTGPPRKNETPCRDAVRHDELAPRRTPYASSSIVAGTLPPCFSTMPGFSYILSGSLMGEPLEVVRCETSDVLVPAGAEIIIEGVIPPGVREQEGPWGDFTKYHQVAMRHPVKITAIKSLAPSRC